MSLFDGISCGHIALDRVGIKVKIYLASLINYHAIYTTMLHYPDTIQIGDVTKVHYDENTKSLYKDCDKEIIVDDNGNFKECKWILGEKVLEGDIDLLIGGSPCQDFSSASLLTPYKDKEEYGLKGSKSKLFYEYLRLKEEIKPKYFLLENVKMKPESEKQLNEYMGVSGLHTDSELIGISLMSK